MKTKIDKYIILFLGYLLTFISIQAVETDVLSFHCNEAIIEGITTRVGFSANLRIKTDSGAENQYIDFENFKGYNSSHFIKAENVKVMGTNSSYLKFSKDKDGNLRDTMEFSVDGNLIFHWNKMKNRYSKQVRLGKVYYRINQNSREGGNIDIEIDNLNIISILKIVVKKDMDFGTIIAGEKADTRESNRTPAQIEIEGVKGNNVKISMPKNTEIKNGRGDSLTVNLRFRENANEKDEGGKKTLIKKISSNVPKGNIGKTDLVEIDGSVVTKKVSEGNYKGIFTVRVEYED
ncbi:DUF4402 domain-containing protein [uncultured Fusobacterium sp.]|uniref:DUF4402 domain-containing protein n=1 Tax=uncultured Fusobacterium sp. TaxID=159267 RepID=UPI0025DF5458|nr:DUF4402 domain-containing protein [uncultured Fusobacterium sp.]